MIALACAHCAHLLAFDARACPACGHGAGFEPVAGRFYALDDQGLWHDGDQAVEDLVACDNGRLGVCNWLLRADSGRVFCDGCRHNRIIPDLTIAGNLERWTKIETAKKRTIHTLIRLGTPPAVRGPDQFGLTFDFLYDPSAEKGYAPELLTGHQAGLVTINLIEADDVARERLRRDFDEPYRTLVGHFRHEIGHYYWHKLVEFTADLTPFRALFGDERANYAAAMQGYYASKDIPGWEDEYVSRYATMHPWEDFAETFAHYLHIVDTLATIGSFGMVIDVAPGATRGPQPVVDFDPFTADTATLVDCWIPMAFAINAINRSMGQPDLYPFRITPQIVLKLDFVNRLLAFAAGRWTPGDREGAGLKAMIATLGHGVDLAE
ncbi:zinc-binding metallopeptidase family protein [Sphingomonas abietis]|uniref:Zinc-binding metallopeptidase n=1 Tax=Sphingomonas abietis TaxID=3012344 RepID=A0ABY7NR95_9SPHN|nr:putative zinc-binding metallopeptidase [Sphingomonas abietis]WBO24055.1 putative zinc-binding metallopeptidase [Sphingomonas abietis]